MPIDPTKIAGIAINQLQAQSNQAEESISIDADRKAEAEYWAKLALEDMQDTYGIDPHYFYTSRAEQVAITFTKVAITGRDPAVSEPYRIMADQWAERAQEKKHQEERDPDSSGRMDLYET